MKRYFLLLIVLLQTIVVCAMVKDNPLVQAQKVALGTNKLILVDFYADWCGPCKMMDAESWNKPDVKEISSNYIFVKIDIDKFRSIAEDYGIQGIPYIFILDPNGEVVFKNIGYLNKTDLKEILNKYAINLKYLQTSYLINYKKETIGSSIRIATKLQEFSVILDDSIKNDFLLLSKIYLSKAEKMLRKDKSPLYSQKIALLYLQESLIKGNYDKVTKKLNSNFNREEIEEPNKALYYFLNHMICNYNEQFEMANEWLIELKKQEGNKILLKEIELIGLKD
ncbi:MAG: thioredoxin domain-containing protein [Flavobacteriaceae bacterium]|nr:thioredoxin domain-containing protein [Flavobacteriaceae bacterium]